MNITNVPKINKANIYYNSHQVLAATKSVTLNCMEIEISSVSYLADGAGTEVTGSVELKKEQETAIFTFPEELKVRLRV